MFVCYHLLKSAKIMCEPLPVLAVYKIVYTYLNFQTFYLLVVTLII